MDRLSRLWVFLAACVCGCAPSMEAKSAGEIGCSPNEITITNDRYHLGLVQSGKTWVAECRGRTFVCSQINPSGSDHDLLDQIFASEEVRCREQAEPPEVERERLAQAAASAARASLPPAPAPVGAAGFDFGETPENAAQRCEAAGLTWRAGDERPSCSGAPVSLGIPVRVEFTFCNGRTCAITIEHLPPAGISRRAVLLKAKLEAKYGPAQESSGPIPEPCRNDRAFAACLETRRVTLRYAWSWTGGESLEMSVGKPAGTERAAIRLHYRRAPGAANIWAL